MGHRLSRFMFAAAMIPPNAPLSERIAVLSKYISPQPGSNIEIDRSLTASNAVTTKKPEQLYGWIKLSPPKGQCFVVTTDKNRPDQNICKTTSLKWFLKDLDAERASISWSIKTSPQDFGTPVSWSTPYTIAKVLPAGSKFNTETSLPEFFKSCTAALGRDDGTLRKITLTKFNNQKWIIRFPDIDTPLTAKEKIETPPPEPKKDDGGHGGGHGDGHEEKKDDGGHGGGHGEKKPEEPTASEDKEKLKDEPEPWTMNSGRGFEMNVENFVSSGAMPPGKKGTCRYVYDYPPGDFSKGRLECHHTDEYLYVYALIPCMKQLLPTKK